MATPGVQFLICIPSLEQEQRLQRKNKFSAESLFNSPEVCANKDFISDKYPSVFVDNEKYERRDSFPKISKSVSDKTSINTNKQTYLTVKQYESLNTSDNINIDKEQNYTKADIISMEKKIEMCLKELNIENAVWSTNKKKKYFQISFCVASGEPCEEVLRVLSQFNIGVELNSTVSVIPCSLYYESDEKISSNPRSPESNVKPIHHPIPVVLKQVTSWEHFVSSVRARLTVAEIIAGFKANAFLTFDFVILLIIASFLAALGLVVNSIFILVASMLISPLMGPVMAGTLGFMIKDRNLQTLGIRNEIIGLLLCVVIGYLFGVIVSVLNIQIDNETWPTEEMKYKGKIESLWVGALIALPSGAAVAIAVLGGNSGSLFGVAISLSVMPPAVNAGLLWGLATVTYIIGPNAIMPFTNLSTKEHVGELIRLGAISICLTFVNIMCIFVSSTIVFKIKEVNSSGSTYYSKLFWKETFKIARDYKHISNEDLNFGQRLVEEMDNCKTVKDDFQTFNLLKKHPNFLRLNQNTWSPCSSEICHRPSAQELSYLLHQNLTCRTTNWRSGNQHLCKWNPVNQPSFTQNDSPTSQLPPIFENRNQANVPNTYGRRFVVTPALDP